MDLKPIGSIETTLAQFTKLHVLVVSISYESYTRYILDYKL